MYLEFLVVSHCFILYSGLKMQYVISAARGLSIRIKTREKGSIMRQCGIMGFVYFIIKQPPLLMKIRVKQAEMFTKEVIYWSFIYVGFSHGLPTSSFTVTGVRKWAAGDKMNLIQISVCLNILEKHLGWSEDTNQKIHNKVTVVFSNLDVKTSHIHTSRRTNETM